MNLFLPIVIILSLILSCGRSSSQQDQSQSQAMQTENANTSKCQSQSAGLTNTQDLIDRLNAMQKPITLPCFIASLAEPLLVSASTSVISAQPALALDRPRIFIKSENLILSIVPGDSLLEIGEEWRDSLSIKGELSFPIKEDLVANSPFLSTGPLFNRGTRCGAPCHAKAEERSKIGGISVWASTIVRPHPASVLEFKQLLDYAQNCKDEQEDACQLYRAMTELGMEEFQFDETLPFFE